MDVADRIPSDFYACGCSCRIGSKLIVDVVALLFDLHRNAFLIDIRFRFNDRLDATWVNEAKLFDSVTRILIVDDNDDNRYTLQMLLEADGYERIESAAGGNEAIALLNKGTFNLVLLDMMMPDLNGLEVLGERDIDHLPVGRICEADPR